MRSSISILRHGVAAALAIVLLTLPSSAATLRCEIAAKQLCQSALGCSAAPAKVYNLVDPSTLNYARCDSLGCDTYEASIATSGNFLIIDIPGRGMLAKLDLETLAFLEVVTLTDMIYVSWGNCVPQN